MFIGKKQRSEMSRELGIAVHAGEKARPIQIAVVEKTRAFECSGLWWIQVAGGVLSSRPTRPPARRQVMCGEVARLLKYERQCV